MPTRPTSALSAIRPARDFRSHWLAGSRSPFCPPDQLAGEPGPDREARRGIYFLSSPKRQRPTFSSRPSWRPSGRGIDLRSDTGARAESKCCPRAIKSGRQFCFVLRAPPRFEMSIKITHASDVSSRLSHLHGERENYLGAPSYSATTARAAALGFRLRSADLEQIWWSSQEAGHCVSTRIPRHDSSRSAFAIPM